MTRKNAIEEAVYAVAAQYKDETLSCFDRDDDGRTMDERMLSVRHALEIGTRVYDPLDTALDRSFRSADLSLPTALDKETARDRLWGYLSEYVVGVFEDSDDLYFEKPFDGMGEPVLYRGMDKVATFKTRGIPGSTEGDPTTGRANALFALRHVNSSARYDGEGEAVDGMSPGPWRLVHLSYGSDGIALVAGPEGDAEVVAFVDRMFEDEFRSVAERATELAADLRHAAPTPA